MKFAAAALLAIVLFADASEAHRGKRRHRHKKGNRLSCKYVEDADDKTSDRFMIAIGQKSSDTDPNPNPVKIMGSAKNFTATAGDLLQLKSWDTAGCTGTEKLLSKGTITAEEKTCRRTDTTFIAAKIGRIEDTTGDALTTYASFQLLADDGTALMCCDTEQPSTRMLYSEFLLN